jgi:hypothetical protein
MVTLVAGIVVVPATVNIPLLVSLVNSFKLFTPNVWIKALSACLPPSKMRRLKITLALKFLLAIGCGVVMTKLDLDTPFLSGALVESSSFVSVSQTCPKEKDGCLNNVQQHDNGPRQVNS